MPKLKPGTILPTPEEDVAITAAAKSDLDNPPMTNAELSKLKRIGGRRGRQKKKPDPEMIDDENP